MSDEGHRLSNTAVPTGNFELLIASMMQGASLADGLGRMANGARILRPDLEFQVSSRQGRVQLTIRFSNGETLAQAIYLEALVTVIHCAVRWGLEQAVDPLRIRGPRSSAQTRGLGSTFSDPPFSDKAKEYPSSIQRMSAPRPACIKGGRGAPRTAIAGSAAGPRSAIERRAGPKGCRKRLGHECAVVTEAAEGRGRFVSGNPDGIETQAALHEGLAWDWENFPDYLDALERRPHDVAAQLPHAALRIFVMGERGARLEIARDDDIAQMRRLAREAMEAGALGFTTSRTLNHRTKRGDPTPSLRAAEAELTGILQGLDDASAGVFEMISDFDSPGPDAKFDMVRRLAQRFSRPTTLSLAQVHHDPTTWRTLLGLIADAADNGLAIKGQVAPRPVGTLLGLQANLNPFSGHQSFRSLASLSFAAKVAALREQAFRAQMMSETPVGRAAEAVGRFSDFDRIFPLGNPPNYAPAPESSLAAIAQASGRPVLDIALDLMMADEGRGFLFAPFSNFADRNLEACRTMLDSPHTLVGLSDGGAHVGMISDASFPTFLLTYWGRDRPTGRFDLARLVKMQTWDTAQAVGLLDRGCIAPGDKADLNVIDFDNLALHPPTMVDDLPAGGRRLLQRVDGYDATVKSGVVTYRKGEPTGALPGRLVRGAQPTPSI